MSVCGKPVWTVAHVWPCHTLFDVSGQHHAQPFLQAHYGSAWKQPIGLMIPLPNVICHKSVSVGAFPRWLEWSWNHPFQSWDWTVLAYNSTLTLLHYKPIQMSLRGNDYELSLSATLTFYTRFFLRSPDSFPLQELMSRSYHMRQWSSRTVSIDSKYVYVYKPNCMRFHLCSILLIPARGCGVCPHGNQGACRCPGADWGLISFLPTRQYTCGGNPPKTLGSQLGSVFSRPPKFWGIYSLFYLYKFVNKALN